jgi:hypothetical protein
MTIIFAILQLKKNWNFNREINLGGTLGWCYLKQGKEDDRYEGRDADWYALGHPVANHSDQHIGTVGLLGTYHNRYGTCQQGYEHDLKGRLVLAEEEVNFWVPEWIPNFSNWIHVCWIFLTTNITQRNK